MRLECVYNRLTNPINDELNVRNMKRLIGVSNFVGYILRTYHDHVGGIIKQFTKLNRKATTEV